MIDAAVVSRLTWLHGEALCPSCRLPIDSRDVDEELREVGETQASGAVVTHRGRSDVPIRFGSENLEALGGSPTHPVKEVVSDAAGLMAGLYNKVRTEGTAKALRDDHVALNLAYVSYTTLHTTALGDPETAALAKRSLVECAAFVTEIDHLVGATVFAELQDDGLGSLDGAAPDQTRLAMREAWIGSENAEHTTGEATAGRL